LNLFIDFHEKWIYNQIIKFHDTWKGGDDLHLNECIRNYRKSKGISQKHIAKELNISVSGYNMKELGKRPINTDELQIIAKSLGVSPSYFFEEELHVKCNRTTA
jgi:ribosome-binding protein aMBF1 (putative translation factor)